MSDFQITEEQYYQMYGVVSEEEVLRHIGTMDQSGRYVRGSGEDPYQRVKEYAAINARMKKEIPDEAERARAMGFKSTGEYRKYTTVATGMKRNYDQEAAERLKERGHSYEAIAAKLDISPTKARDLVKPRQDLKQNRRAQAAAALKAQVDHRSFLDVGEGTESSMGITKDMKAKALYELELQGYKVYNIHELQMNGNKTNTLVLAKPGVSFQDARDNIPNIKPYVGKIDEFDRNMNPLGFERPIAVDPKRLQVAWKEDGGDTRDGVIFVRPGAEGLSLGNSRYAQVRIQIGPEHYAKGMAVYKNDLPDGVDLLFNSNKPRSANKMDALKELERNKQTGEVDYDNPFGSIVTQLKDDKGNVSSAMNIVNDDEKWDRWSKNLSSQFLSKQSIPLARTQLDLTRARRASDLEDILSLENNVVKKYMLDKYADSTDAAAEHLKAAQLPGQKTHVILPINTLKENEVYAPNFENGTRVALVRFPHGGTFEIPKLVVNNNNKEGAELIGNDSKAAIGIHYTKAEQMSGADFDGDTVVLIPDNQNRITSRPPLKGLENFDTKDAYGYTGPGKPKSDSDYPYKIMSKGNTNTQMGMISNLLNDMQLKGADDEEIARAAKHSMVVIDAAKHKLDYQRSAKENGIPALKKKYQYNEETGKEGAATIISRARSRVEVPQAELRKASDDGPIDRETGELVWVPTGKAKRVKNKVTGEWEDSDSPKTMKTTRMAVAKDAHELSSGTAMESLYADYANEMKSLANRSRLEMINTPDPAWSREAEAKYATEVKSLNEALDRAKANAPRERHAQRVAAAMVKVREEENPDMTRGELKKIKGATIRTARELTGANKARIRPTDKEWEAIQAGAISATKLRDILSNGDTDYIRELAMPRKKTTVTPAQSSRIKSLSAQGYTQAEIAERLGISTSTVNEYL